MATARLSTSSLTHENLKRLDSQNSIDARQIAQLQQTACEKASLDGQMCAEIVQSTEAASAQKSRFAEEAQRHRLTFSMPEEAKRKASQRRQRMKISDFERLAILGEGAFGKVYRVRYVQNDHKFALKRIEKSLLIREGKQKQALIQKETMLYLDHPQIVKLYETFQDRKYFYFLMELVPNGTLAELYDRRPFNHEMIKFYSAQLVALLDYIFSKKVAHRDLKPENFLLDEKHHLKLADFGTAKRLGPSRLSHMDENQDASGEVEQQRKGTLVGTRFYVAPQVLNQECSGFAADLWSLGCIIYKLICGKTPFEADNQYLVYQKIKSVDLTFSKAFDPDAIDLITRLLQLQPEARIGMSGEDFSQTAIHQLKEHPYFKGIDFNSIFEIDAPSAVTGRKKFKDSRKISDQTEFSTPVSKVKTDDLSTQPDQASTARLLSDYFLGNYEPEHRATHLSVSAFIKEDGIFGSSSQEISKPSFAFYEDQCPIEVEKTKYFKAVRIFARPHENRETIFKSKMVYLQKGLKNKKLIASMTTEPRILLCDPSTNKIIEDIPLTLSLDLTPSSEKDLIIRTTYGKCYRFKDGSREARNAWIKQIEYAVNMFYKPKFLQI